MKSVQRKPTISYRQRKQCDQAFCFFPLGKRYDSHHCAWESMTRLSIISPFCVSGPAVCSFVCFGVFMLFNPRCLNAPPKNTRRRVCVVCVGAPFCGTLVVFLISGLLLCYFSTVRVFLEYINVACAVCDRFLCTELGRSHVRPYVLFPHVFHSSCFHAFALLPRGSRRGCFALGTYLTSRNTQSYLFHFVHPLAHTCSRSHSHGSALL